MRQITYLQAIGEAMREEMRRDPRVFLMGEDIEANVFGTATGFKDEFGADLCWLLLPKRGSRWMQNGC
jgi:pyruvate/2-oxoglutarate/acetoin dehydrogenase E1 component